MTIYNYVLFCVYSVNGGLLGCSMQMPWLVHGDALTSPDEPLANALDT